MATDREFTLPEVRFRFLQEQSLHYTRQWSVLNMDHILDSTPERGWPIDRALMIGSGSFSTTSSQRPLRQLVFFLQVAHIVRTNLAPRHPAKGQIFRLYAHDASYTRTDKQLLNSLGVGVLQAPEIFSLIDHHTFAYTPFVNIDVTVPNIILAPTPPCLYIGHGVRSDINATNGVDNAQTNGDDNVGTNGVDDVGTNGVVEPVDLDSTDPEYEEPDDSDDSGDNAHTNGVDNAQTNGVVEPVHLESNGS
ncbi:hypothetical protein QBC43DRAFT_287174 [Cladorrhinum sp. PSN259]|nr:hypothetical protein QBC43DRAFT_287174 [Cladorrhinum sp. PSN259]